MKRAGVVVLVALALMAAPFATRPAGAANPLVLVYGDSLVNEATSYADHLLRAVGGIEGLVFGVPGAATCDILPRMRQDAADYHPVAVVVAFSGNAFSPCMKHADGSALSIDEWVDRYRAANVEVIKTFRAGSPTIWLATAPIPLNDDPATSGVRKLAAMQRELASENPRVRVVESGAAVEDGGRWARWMPCLPNEPCQGGVDTWGRRVNFVRSPDGVHFCPIPFSPTNNCPVHASGGLRYAIGMLAPVLQSLGRWDPAHVSRSMAAGWQPSP